MGIDLNVVVPRTFGPRKITRLTLNDLSEDFLYRCGQIMLTQNEVATLLGVTQGAFSKALKRNPDLALAFDQGRAVGKASLRRAQWENAVEKGNVVMQIWLGKNELGQRDSVKEIEAKTDVQVTYVAMWGGRMAGQVAEGGPQAGLPSPAQLDDDDDDEIIEGESEEVEG